MPVGNEPFQDLVIGEYRTMCTSGCNDMKETALSISSKVTTVRRNLERSAIASSKTREGCKMEEVRERARSPRVMRTR